MEILCNLISSTYFNSVKVVAFATKWVVQVKCGHSHTLFLVSSNPVDEEARRDRFDNIEIAEPPASSGSIITDQKVKLTPPPESTSLGTIGLLPNEVILYLFSFLDVSALCTLARVSSLLR